MSEPVSDSKLSVMSSLRTCDACGAILPPGKGRRMVWARDVSPSPNGNGTMKHPSYKQERSFVYCDSSDSCLWRIRIIAQAWQKGAI